MTDTVDVHATYGGRRSGLDIDVVADLTAAATALIDVECGATDTPWLGDR